MKLISIIVPIYNESKHIEVFYKTLLSVWKNLKNSYDFSLIYVNDGSTDDTISEIEKLSKKDKRVKQIEFSKNFGKEVAISAGLAYAEGDAAIIIDGDLQHPIELMPEFIDAWEKGAEVVVGMREKNKKEKLFRKFGTKFYTTVLHMISDSSFISQGTDYRLIDRKVINAFNKCSERNRITRGLIDWLGFRKEFIYFKANERMYGEPAYTLTKLIRLFMHSCVSMSMFPLKLAGYIGIVITLFSIGLGTFIILEQYLMKDPLGLGFSGTAQLAILNIFLIGIVLSCLGLIALYIANIHTEVLNRPFYVIRNKMNL